MGTRTSSDQVPAVKITFATTDALRGVVEDFAEYNGLETPELARMLLVENTGVLDGHDYNTVSVIIGGYRSVLSPLLGGVKRAKINTTIDKDTGAIYDAHVARLETSLGWVARVTILHGLVKEMQSEGYVPC